MTDMPQPLSRLRSTVSGITWGTKTLDGKPELAILVAAIFSEWAFIETQLKNLMVVVLGSDAAPALAIYDSLDSPRQQMRALKAAAQAHLSADKFDIFSAAISVVEAAQRDRNRIAHWVWTSCPEFPDALILTDPDYIAEYMLNFQKCLEVALKCDSTDSEFDNLVGLDGDKMLVYRKDDLTHALSSLAEARLMLFTLRSFLTLSAQYVHDYLKFGLANQVEQARRQLLASPQIQEALARASARNQKTQ